MEEGKLAWAGGRKEAATYDDGEVEDKQIASANREAALRDAGIEALPRLAGRFLKNPSAIVSETARCSRKYMTCVAGSQTWHQALLFADRMGSNGRTG